MRRVYVLKLDSNKWYVGKTSRPIQLRTLEHSQYKGAEWTRQYKPVSVEKIIKNADAFDEDKYTKIYMAKHGINNVRGGSYVSTYLTPSQKQCLRNEIYTAQDRCFGCGEKGHFVTNCKNKMKCEWCGRNSHTKNNCYAKINIQWNPLNRDLN